MSKDGRGAGASTALLVLLALWACQPQRGTAPVADGMPGMADGDAGNENTGAQASSRADDADGTDAAAGTAPDTATVQARPWQVRGADAPGLRTRLGAPAQRRHDAAARVWQYRLESCVLDVFLYRENGTAHVAHLEARDRQGAPMATQDCLQRLLAARANDADDA